LRLEDIDDAKQRTGDVDQPVGAFGKAVGELETRRYLSAAGAVAERDVAGTEEGRKVVFLPPTR
jgi:hypothetical protein